MKHGFDHFFWWQNDAEGIDALHLAIRHADSHGHASAAVLKDGSTNGLTADAVHPHGVVEESVYRVDVRHDRLPGSAPRPQEQALAVNGCHHSR